MTICESFDPFSAYGLTDGRSGQAVPVDLEDLVNQVNTMDAIISNVAERYATEVKVISTESRKRVRISPVRKCNYCHKEGHSRSHCHKLRRDTRAEKTAPKEAKVTEDVLHSTYVDPLDLGTGAAKSERQR